LSRERQSSRRFWGNLPPVEGNFCLNSSRLSESEISSDNLLLSAFQRNYCKYIIEYNFAARQYFLPMKTYAVKKYVFRAVLISALLYTLFFV